MGITYIPMARGFVYLVAVLDWFSRKVLAWRLSTTLETGACIEALKDIMRRHGKFVRNKMLFVAAKQSPSNGPTLQYGHFADRSLPLTPHQSGTMRP